MMIFEEMTRQKAWNGCATLPFLKKWTTTICLHVEFLCCNANLQNCAIFSRPTHSSFVKGGGGEKTFQSDVPPPQRLPDAPVTVEHTAVSQEQKNLDLLRRRGLGRPS